MCESTSLQLLRSSKFLLLISNLTGCDDDLEEGVPVDDYIEWFGPGVTATKFREVLRLMGINMLRKSQATLPRALNRKALHKPSWSILGPLGLGKSFVVAVQLARAAHTMLATDGTKGIAAIAIYAKLGSAVEAAQSLHALTWDIGI